MDANGNLTSGAGAIEKEITSGGTRIKTYLPLGIGYLEETTTSPIAQGRYFRKDHLGSTGVITSESGAVLERLSYDAWGSRRNSDGSDDATYALKSSQDRTGYTGQEHLEEVGLVHLNGRGRVLPVATGTVSNFVCEAR